MNQTQSVNESPAARLTPEQTDARDRLHLKLLMIFHYVLGGVAIGGGLHMLISLIPFLIMGTFIPEPDMAYRMDQGVQSVTSVMETIFLVYAVVMITFSLMAVVAGPISIVAGRRLRDRRSYGFVRAWAIWQWVLLFPMGIALGICLRNVLKRESVKARFTW